VTSTSPFDLDCPLCHEKFISETKYSEHIEDIHMSWISPESPNQKANTNIQFGNFLKHFNYLLLKITVVFFLSISNKNNVCFNLTTETSKYQVEVSRLYHWCFQGFFDFLFDNFEKIKACVAFFRNFSQVTLKNEYFVFKVEI
jgi:hypothetical protein